MPGRVVLHVSNVIDEAALNFRLLTEADHSNAMTESCNILLYGEILGQALLTLDLRIQGILHLAYWVIDPPLLTGFIPPCSLQSMTY